MSLIGKKLGGYEILERLGAGGIGEVYRARDPRLDREIAIKVLPEAVAADETRLGRFEREARMLAALNHGNIAAVHGLETAEGVVFLVQELIEGEALARRLGRGRLELDAVLDIGRQIAEALETAHAANIVHRDLKPDNVMVTDDGHVKVLDFGLAKPVVDETGERAEPHDSNDSPTRSRSLGGEREDVILGTAAYMSPDQARGRPIDQRSDIWSFGCVMYEMITGVRAFGGDTLLDTLAAVVRADVDWDRLPDDTPPKIHDLVRRCLAADPRRRQRDIGDARIEIEEVLEDPRRGGATEATSSAAARVQRKVSWGLAILTAASIAFAAWAWWQRSAGPDPTVIRSALTIDPGQHLVMEPYASLAIAPAGDRIAYVAEREGIQYLYLRNLSQPVPVEVPGSEGATNPFFSPDGEWVAFFGGGKLKKVAVLGGGPLEICDVPTGNSGGVWLEDGDIVFAYAFTADGLQRVSSEGGEDPQQITTPGEREISHQWPRALSGDRAILFSSTDDGGRHQVQLLSLQESGAEPEPLIEDTEEAHYLETGHLLYARAGAVVAAPFDIDRLELTGPAFSVLDDVHVGDSGTRAFVTVSSDGTLAYVPGHGSADEDRLVWVDRSGGTSVAVDAPGRFGHPRLSPDGATVAVDSGTGAESDILTFDLDRGTATRVTVSGRNVMPVWSPGGEWIAYSSEQGGPAALYRVGTGGGGTPELLYGDSEVASWVRSWSPDGSTIAFYQLKTVGGTGRDLWIYDLPGGRAEEYVATPFNERSPAFSPDGRWIAYVSNESGRDEVYARSYPRPDTKIAISNTGGREPVWSPDGQTLYYRNSDRMYAVAIDLLEGELEAGEPESLFTGRFRFDNTAHNQYYDVARDGRFLMVQRTDESRPDHLHLVLNWFEELGRRAASR